MPGAAVLRPPFFSQFWRRRDYASQKTARGQAPPPTLSWPTSGRGGSGPAGCACVLRGFLSGWRRRPFCAAATATAAASLSRSGCGAGGETERGAPGPSPAPSRRAPEPPSARLPRLRAHQYGRRRAAQDPVSEAGPGRAGPRRGRGGPLGRFRGPRALCERGPGWAGLGTAVSRARPGARWVVQAAGPRACPERVGESDPSRQWVLLRSDDSARVVRPG